MIRSIRSRMSLVATSRSVPQAKETRTWLRPSAEVELISSTPCTAASDSSSGLVTSSSISWRTDVAVGGDDRDGRVGDLGHQVDRQAREGDGAQRDDHQEDDGREDGALDRAPGEAHATSRPSPAGRRGEDDRAAVLQQVLAQGDHLPGEFGRQDLRHRRGGDSRLHRDEAGDGLAPGDERRRRVEPLRADDGGGGDDLGVAAFSDRTIRPGRTSRASAAWAAFGASISISAIREASWRTGAMRAILPGEPPVRDGRRRSISAAWPTLMRP